VDTRAALFLAAVWLGGCSAVSETSPGISVEVLVEPTASSAVQPDGSWIATNNLGYEIKADATGLRANPWLVGKTLYLEGTFRRGDQGPKPFAAWSSASLFIDASLPSLELSADAPNATLMVRKSSDHWFDDLDLALQSPESLGEAVLANITRSIVVDPQ
jgi:hypothetical protein